MKNNKVDICFTQEAYCTADQEKKFDVVNGVKQFYSHMGLTEPEG